MTLFCFARISEVWFEGKCAVKGPSGKGLMQHERVCLEGGSTWGLLDPSWVHKDPLELFAWEKKITFLVL